jgi:type IV pilus assembly protein PilA
MKNLKNKSGFTLIEIIVVLIIIGILVAIALPNLFSNIPKSQGSTALASADAYKTVLEQCLGQNSTTSPGAVPCTMAALNLSPSIQGITITLTDASGGTGTAAAGDLTYTIAGTAGTAPVFTITRASNGVFSCTSPATSTGSAYAALCS